MTFNNNSIRLLFFGTLFGVALPLRAQNPAPVRAAPVLRPAQAKPLEANPPANEPAEEEYVTLQDILAKARLGRVGLGLAIGAEGEAQPVKEVAKANPDTVDRAAAAFKMATQTFGSVLAIGPQTYTELASDFTGANAFADMPPTQAFTLLLASLDDGQRTALASKTGLGLHDLTTATQKQLFAVLLPDSDVSVLRRGEPNDNPGDSQGKDIGNLREKADTVHFRVAQEVTLQAEMKALEYGRRDVPPLTGANTPVYYDLSSTVYANKDKVNGVVIRREVPNRLKRSDLNYDSPRLQVPIPIKDLKTVGDLIARVAKQTGLELYTDPGYETHTLTWVANGKTAASASEMLRAVAFSLAATYRRVGTAFVLTEDVTGLGTRRQKIQDFEEECDAERQQALQDAEKSLRENSAQKNLKLNGFNDPLAMTPEQEKTHPDPQKISDMMDVFGSLGGASLPYDKLTAQQKEAVQNYEAAQQKSAAEPGNEADQGKYRPDFDKNFHVLKKLSVQMVINGLDGVVSTDFGVTLMPLFMPTPPKIEVPAATLQQYQNLPKWTETAKDYARRAVICRPRTTADVDASLIRIAALGFNQMWMTVFESGKARIPGTPFPLDPACDPKTDLLTYAIAEGKKKGITICPVIYVFAWGADAPAGLRLLTLRGENSAQSAARRFKINSLKPDSPLSQYMPNTMKLKNLPPSADLWVDPTQPTALTALTGLIQAIAGHVGAGDCVCRNLTPAGFGGQEMNFGGVFQAASASLGYNEALRLAFLKKNHCDPVDLPNFNYDANTNRANTTLTQYEAQNDYGQAQQWSEFRKAAMQTALRSLLDSLLKGAGDKKPSVIVAQDSMGAFVSWFDIISDPNAPLPGSNLFSSALATALGGAANGASTPPALPSSIFLLSKEPPMALPKELAGADWLSMEIKTLDVYKGYRKWEGLVIEE